MKSIQKKIQALKQQIRHHDRLYYNLDQPEITDYEYDQLFKKLAHLENQYPELKTEDSPTQKMPGQALEKFKKAPHGLAMLSLQNSYSKEEIKAFYEKTLKFLNKKSLTCFVEPKLDGMAVELIYKNGQLSQALTRGDGRLGEDITANIKTLKGLPLSLDKPLPSTKRGDGSLPPLLEFRGEVLIFKKDFEKINISRKEKGLSLFANPRNLSAGSLRQLDPQVTASRPLYCFIHSPGRIQGLNIKSQEEFVRRVQNFSFASFQISSSKKLKPPLELCRLTHSIEEIGDSYDQLLELSHKLPFEIDGIVIKVNDFEQQKELGAIARSPRWAIAGKFPPERGITQVEDIRLQVGRTGVVTPVAQLKPLTLSGVQIRQASLHNFQDLKRKDIRIKDFVWVHRAGDVIPELIKALKDKRAKGLKTFPPPENCPVCQSVLKAQGDYLLCSNGECPAIKENKFRHFASKGAMNIEFLGKKSLKKFYDWGWLNCYSDIYDLKDKPIQNKEGFGEKSHKLLVKSLEESKSTSLPRLIFALGIPLIGEQSAQKISQVIYETWGEKELSLRQAITWLKNWTIEELEKVEDIGPLSARSFHFAFQNEDLISDLKRLAEHGVHFVKLKKEEESLKGLSYVITGTFPEHREKIKKWIENRGGTVGSQVSQKTSFLLMGDNPGSKQKKAQELKIPILSWETFLKRIGKSQ